MVRAIDVVSISLIAGIEKFDFRHYNETKFAGLEIHIPNAYCNSMIQVSQHRVLQKLSVFETL